MYKRNMQNVCCSRNLIILFIYCGSRTSRCNEFFQHLINIIFYVKKSPNMPTFNLQYNGVHIADSCRSSDQMCFIVEKTRSTAAVVPCCRHTMFWTTLIRLGTSTWWSCTCLNNLIHLLTYKIWVVVELYSSFFDARKVFCEWHLIKMTVSINYFSTI